MIQDTISELYSVIKRVSIEIITLHDHYWILYAGGIIFYTSVYAALHVSVRQLRMIWHLRTLIKTQERTVTDAEGERTDRFALWVQSRSGIRYCDSPEQSGCYANQTSTREHDRFYGRRDTLQETWSHCELEENPGVGAEVFRYNELRNVVCVGHETRFLCCEQDVPCAFLLSRVSSFPLTGPSLGSPWFVRDRSSFAHRATFGCFTLVSSPRAVVPHPRFSPRASAHVKESH